MRRRTHNNYAKFLLGGKKVKMETIDKINGAIDNPSLQDKNFMELYDAKEFDFLGLMEKGSHRNVNHDPISGLYKALSIDPINGFEIYLAHAMADKMSNLVRENFGADNRDIGEVLFNRMLTTLNHSKPMYSKKFAPKVIKNPYLELIKRNKFYRYKNSKKKRF